MSNDTTAPVTIITDVPETTEPVAKKSFFQKNIVTPIKNHPKLSLAIAAGVALVVGAAVLGGKDDKVDETPVPDDTIEIIPTESGFEVVDLTLTEG